MDAGLRVVTRIPLEELWQVDQSAIGSRQRGLTADDVSRMLRESPVAFVVAEVGKALHWIAPEDRYEFWKNEVKPHLANHSQIVLNNFPDSYCYIASEWSAKTGAPIILLERHH